MNTINTPVFLELADGATVLMPDGSDYVSNLDIDPDEETPLPEWDFTKDGAKLNLGNISIPLPVDVVSHLIAVDTEMPVLNLYSNTGIMRPFIRQILLDKRELHQIFGAYKYLISV